LKSHRIPKLVTKPEGISEICRRLEKESIIALDTEFIRETTFFPKIALIQVATRDEAWLIDPVVLTREDLEPLLRVFTDKNILKVIHASYADQECLFWAYDCIVDPVLDTSVAAALCGIGDNVGLQKLLKDEIGVSIPKGRSRVKWLARPLADELLIYAEEDVLHLVDLGISIKERCEKLNRWEWTLEESQSSKEQFDISPEAMAHKMGKNSHLDNVGRAVLLELVTWRENRAKTKNVPRHWVVDNEVLISLAKVRPRSAAELKTFRGLNAKEIERSGEEILQAVNRGLEQGKQQPPQEIHFHHRGPQIETHIVNLVQSYVAYLAREHSIANRYLLNAPQIEWLLKNQNESIETWIRMGILSSRAANLVGKELKSFLLGEVGIKIFQGEVKIFNLS
jgi:ribonuclease D